MDGTEASSSELEVAQRSEVARLLQQIRDEHESAVLGLTGLAYGTAQHQVITQKMENMGKWHEELQVLVGDGAMALIVQALDSIPDVRSTSV